MPQRRQRPRISWPAELLADVASTAVLTLIFHFVLDMPWQWAFLCAALPTVTAIWCLVHLEHKDVDSTSSGTSSRSGGWLSDWLD